MQKFPGNLPYNSFTEHLKNNFGCKVYKISVDAGFTCPNRNGTKDWGIMQVNSCHSAMVGGNLQLLLDADTNVRIGKQIKDGSGWSAWTTFRSGAYKRYL